jgi:hypothetical protein
VVIGSCKSKKDKQHNGQKKKDKGTNNDLQNITQKTKDQSTRTLPHCVTHDFKIWKYQRAGYFGRLKVVFW